jgi:hypothetical protein
MSDMNSSHLQSRMARKMAAGPPLGPDLRVQPTGLHGIDMGPAFSARKGVPQMRFMGNAGRLEVPGTRHMDG